METEAGQLQKPKNDISDNDKGEMHIVDRYCYGVFKRQKSLNNVW
jgi:hypothetical protein